DVEDHGLHDLSLLQDLRRVLDALGPRKIGNVHQAVDAFLDFDECPEIGHVPDPALHHRSHAVAAVDGGPRVRFELLQAERNPAILGVNLEHHGFHLVARLHHFGRVLHAAGPSHLTDVDQSLDSRFELDKFAVGGHIDHASDYPAVDRISLGHRFPRVGLELLDPERDPLLGAVELQNLYRDLGA